MKYVLSLFVLFGLLFGYPDDHFKLNGIMSNESNQFYMEYDYQDGPMSASYAQYASDHILRMAFLGKIYDDNYTYYLETSIEEDTVFDSTNLSYMVGIGKTIFHQGGIKNKVSACGNFVNNIYITSLRNKFEYNYYNTHIKLITFLYPETGDLKNHGSIKYKVAKNFDLGIDYKSKNNQYRAAIFLETSFVPKEVK